ncbi:MAG: FAD-dependent oxidoreductase, partial [Candidatus Onthomonas sp.]|nr:FAD-dependent oxidoreductase [Candidatus Onthomonas sp.]
MEYDKLNRVIIMLRINNIRMPLDYRPEQLERKLCQALRISGGIQEVHLVKQSVDARRKNDLHLVLSVNVQVADEANIARRLHSNNVRLLTRQTYQFPQVRRTSSLPPVVVGMGPAGLFAALYLARNGLPSIVLERGAPVEERTRLVERFWQTGELNPASNVQFGEGGAGTFSDGKLTTGTHDPRIETVLDTFIQMGAPEDIAHSFRPHVGTDVLREVVRRIRLELLRLGCDIRFGHQVTGLQLANGRLQSVTVSGPDQTYQLDTDALILAPGHSARDTFALLRDCGVPMEPKPFAIGVRIEH